MRRYSSADTPPGIDEKELNVPTYWVSTVKGGVVLVGDHVGEVAGDGSEQGWLRYFYFTPVCPLAPMS